MLFVGKLAESGARLEISGYIHSFDDFWTRPGQDKTMTTGYARLVKVN